MKHRLMKILWTIRPRTYPSDIYFVRSQSSYLCICMFSVFFNTENRFLIFTGFSLFSTNDNTADSRRNRSARIFPLFSTNQDFDKVLFTAFNNCYNFSCINPKTPENTAFTADESALGLSLVLYPFLIFCNDS